VFTAESLRSEIYNMWISRDGATDRARPPSSHKSIVMITHLIEEAVFLADRVFVMAPRPGRIVDTLHIDLSRPRELQAMNSPEFSTYVNSIRAQFNAKAVVGV